MSLARSLAKPLSRPLGGRLGGAVLPTIFTYPFRFADSTGVGMGGEMAGTPVFGTQGEAVNVIRNSIAYGTRSDGVLVSVPANRPRVVSVGGVLSLFVEGAILATNACLWSSDLTKSAVWTASNMTTAFTATHPDPTVLCTTCTATAGNATVTQTITAGSANRATSFYLRRRTGSGTINVTRDGSTWIDVTAAVSSTWARITGATSGASGLNASMTNPVVGIRIVTSGDAVDVALVQSEVLPAANATATSPIETGAASATRAVDTVTVTLPSSPSTAWSFRGKYTPASTWSFAQSSGAGLVHLGPTFNVANSQALYVTNTAGIFIATKDAANALKQNTKAAGYTASNATAHTFHLTHDNVTFAQTFKIDTVAQTLTASGAGTGLVTGPSTTLVLARLGASNNGFNGFISDVVFANTLAGADP